MRTISVVYFSGSGHTQFMAESVAKGAEQVIGTTVKVLRITGEQITQGRWQDETIIEQLNQSDAIVYGSPTTQVGGRPSSKPLLMRPVQSGLIKVGKIKLLAALPILALLVAISRARCFTWLLTPCSTA